MILYIVLAKCGEKVFTEIFRAKERESTMEEKKNAVSTAMDIAKYIISVGSGQEEPVLLSNIKLQKILYLVFGYFYLYSEKLLFAEPFEAWQYGPVVASVYDEFCNFAGSYICLIDKPSALPAEITEVIDPIIETNMRREVFDLVEETHQSGSAWHKAVERAGNVKNHPSLLLEDIIEEFRKRRDGNGLASAL